MLRKQYSKFNLFNFTKKFKLKNKNSFGLSTLYFAIVFGIILLLGVTLINQFLLNNNNKAKASGVTIQFSSAASSVLESANFVGIQVSLSASLDSDATVNYTISSGNAIQNTDFSLVTSASTNTLIIPSGKTNATIPVKIISNNAVNTNKTIQLTLSNPSGVTLGNSTTFTLNILDDDSSYEPLGSDPESLPGFDGLKLRLDANQISGNDGDSVGTWNDSSGNGNSATQATTANQPILKKGNNGVNGQNVVSFDGVDDFLSHNLSLSGQSTFFSVVNRLPGGSAEQGIFAATPANQRVDNIIWSKGTGTGWATYSNGFNDSGVVIGTQHKILATVSNNPPTGSIDMYTDGSLSLKTTGARYAGDAQVRQYIGREHSSRYHSGDIAEILVYDRALSDTERKQVECFLSNKYNLKASGCAGSTKLWLDANQISGNDGDKVGTWSDSSGNGNNATQANIANQPILKKGSNGINGQNVVSFDGANDQLFSNTPATTNTDNWTVFNIVKPSNLGQEDKVFFGNGKDNGGWNNNGYNFGFRSSNNLRVLYGGVVFNEMGTPAITSGGNLVTSSRGGGTLKSYVNGAQTTNTSTSSPNTPTQYYVGSSGDTRYFNGDISEILVLNTSLNTTQRTIYENYLANKYGITISNSSSYTFGSTAPNQIVGIGSASDGTLSNSGSSSGLYISELNQSLGLDETLLSGHDGGSKTIVTTDLPSGVAGRFNRTWAMTKNGSIDTKISFDMSEAGGGIPVNAGNYRLLYRSGNTGNFSTVTTANSTISGDKISFEVVDTNLQNGYYTLATTDNSNSPLSIPNTVTDLVATPQTGNNIDKVNLSWSVPNGNPTSYTVQYSDDNFVNDIQVFGTVSTNSTIVSGLSTNTKYAFRVLATNSAGTGNGSNPTVVTTNSTTPTITNIINPDYNNATGSTVGNYSVNVNGTNFAKPGYKRAISINNNAGTPLTDYQVSFTLDTASLVSSGKMRSDCGDLRVIDSDEFTGLLYWIESGCNTTTTIVWTKIPSINASATKDIFVKYGDIAKTSAQTNPENIFDFYDGFDGSSIDNGKWNVVNSSGFSVSGGQLRGTNTSGKISSIKTYSDGVIQEIKAKTTTIASNGQMIGGFYISGSNALGWLNHPGNAYYRNDGNWVPKPDQTPNSNLLYTIKVKNSTTASLNIFNLDANTDYWNVGDVSNNVSNEPISLGYRYDESSAGQSYQTDWDFIRIRKYAATPPTTAIATEQNTSTISLNFGTSNSATNVQVLSSTQIKATVPASNLTPKNGVVAVTLDQNGQITTSSFEYKAPRVDNLNITSGPTIGGTEVLVNGGYFADTSYKKPLTITNSGSVQSNVKTSALIDTASLVSGGKMQSDCRDLRIKASNMVTDLPYWIEYGCNTASTLVHFSIPSLGLGSNTFYLVYGEGSLLDSQSNRDSVYPVISANSGSLKQWVKANDGPSTTTNGSVVSTVLDKSGNANNWGIQSGYTGAIYNSTGLNNRPSLSFNGSNSYQFANRITDIRTVVMLWNETAAGLEAGSFLLGDTGSYDFHRNGNIAYFNGSYTSPITGGTFKVNGNIVSATSFVPIYNTPTQFSIVTTSNINANTFDKDRSYSGPFKGQFGELMIFNQALSASDVNSLEQYITAKYALNTNYTPVIGAESGSGGGGLLLGTTPASSIQFISSTQLRITTPANTVGTYPIKVVSSDGTESNTTVNFTYAAPTITSVTPATGPNSGGTYVEIKGSNFGSNTTTLTPVTITNPNNTALTDYQVKLTLNTQILISTGKMASDCSNLRVRNIDNNDLPYYLESGCNTANTTIWTKIPSISANGSLKLNILYGNSGWNSQSNGDNVFDFFDEFDGLNNTKFNYGSGVSIVNGNLQIVGPGSRAWGSYYAISKLAFQTFNRPFVVESTATGIGGSSDYMFGVFNSGTGTSYTDMPYAIFNYTGNGNVQIYEDGNNRSISFASNSNQQYKYKIVVKPTGADYYSDDSLRYSSTYSATDNLRIGYTVASSTQQFDNLRVRKYAPTEPTVSLGNSIKAIDVAFGNNSTLFNFVDSQTIRGYTPAGTGNVNIKVTNSDGSNGTSSTNLYTYGNNNVPNPIFDLAITATEGGTVSLGWSATFDNGSAITNHIVRYSQNNFTTYTDFTTQDSNNSAKVTGLIPGQSYKFKVIAVNSSTQNQGNGAGKSLDSNVVNVNNLDCDTNLNGSDLIISSSTTNKTLTGSYCNVGEFRVDSGVTAILNNQASTTAPFTGKAVKIYAQSANVLGTIDGAGLGFLGANQTGNNSPNGLGTGGGIGSGCFSYATGGGYGGKGGDYDTFQGGVSYGSITEPTDLGSGGGAGAGCGIQGGNGGGAIKLTVTGTTTVNGSISANGGNPSGCYASGGSGGSIWINTNILTGNGTITANGGNQTCGWWWSGSGGGGGRIALYYNTKSLTNTTPISNTGGTGNQNGGAGTVYEKSTLQNFGTLTISQNNIGANNANTPINSSNLPSLNTLDNLVITNKATVSLDKDLTINNTTFDINTETIFNVNSVLTFSNSLTTTILNGTLNFKYTPIGSFANFTIQSTGILRHNQNTNSKVSFLDISATNLTIDIGGKIDTTGLGFLGANQTGNNSPNGLGTGGGIGSGCFSYATGGGYGGKGGDYDTFQGGVSYGSITEPTDLGSGGGAGCSIQGGNGGGAIKLTVTGTTTVNGSISANGGNPSGCYASGGSGGSIWINTNILTGNGTITANGGNQTCGWSGSGGGGGRIALYYQTRTGTMTQGTPTSSITVNGGAGAGDCTEVLTGSNPAAYTNNTSGCTGTIYDPNTPELGLVSAVISTNPSPVSLGTDSFVAGGVSIKNIFGYDLFSGSCSLSITGPGGYSQSKTGGTVSLGVCTLPSSFTTPTQTGSYSATLSVTGNSNTQTNSSLTFTVYTQASNKAKADDINTSQPLSGYSLSSAPVPSLIGLTGSSNLLKISISGLKDSGNNQDLNNTACNFNVTYPNGVLDNQNNNSKVFTTPPSGLTGGNCTYTFSQYELPIASGNYSFTVTVAGDNSNLTTTTHYFNRYFDVFLSQTATPDIFDFTGKIPGDVIATVGGSIVNDTNKITAGGADPTFISPAIKKQSNTALVAQGTVCKNILYLNNNLIYTTPSSILDASGKCITLVANNLISDGDLQVKTLITLSLNGNTFDFETNLSPIIPTTGFPSNLAKFNPNPIPPTTYLQPIYTTQSVSTNPSLIDNPITLSLTGLKDSLNGNDLGKSPAIGPVCNFTITRPDASTFTKTSLAVSEGNCSVSVSNADLELKKLGGTFSFRVSVNGKDEDNNNAVLTTPTTGFNRVYNINLTTGDGLTGSIVGSMSATPSVYLNGQTIVAVNQAITFTSTVLKQYDTINNLSSTIPCRVVVRFVPNLGDEVITNYPGTYNNGYINTNGQCSATVPSTVLTSTGNVYVKTKVSLLGSSLDTNNNDVFTTAESQFTVRNPNNSKICATLFRDDNGNGVRDTQAGTGLQNMVGRDEPMMVGVSIKLLDNNLVQIPGKTLTTAIPTPLTLDINCFSDLYDDTYYLEVTFPSPTGYTLTNIDPDDPDNIDNGIFILKNNNNQITGIRFLSVLGVAQTKSFTTALNANAQICIDSTFADISTGYGVFNGSDYRLAKDVRLFKSTDLINQLGVKTTLVPIPNNTNTASSPICFNSLPPSAYSYYNTDTSTVVNDLVTYSLKQNIPQLGDTDFLAGGELTTTNIQNGVILVASGATAISNNITLTDGQNLGDLKFGYKRLASLKAKAQDPPNQTKPVVANTNPVQFEAVVNGNVVANKVYKGYKFNTKVNGLLDSATGNPLTVPVEYGSSCSITFSGAGFTTPSSVTVDGTVTDGVCNIDPIPDTVSPGTNDNTAIMTVQGDSELLTYSANFTVLSGNLSVCVNTFADYNLNGIKDNNESSLPGRIIKLLKNQSGSFIQYKDPITSTLASADCFDDVEPGFEYKIQQDPVLGSTATTNGGSLSYVFTPNPETNQSFNFGYKGNTNICTSAFADYDGIIGVKDGSDSYLDGLADTIFVAVLNDSNGNTVNSLSLNTSNSTRCFDQLTTGTYTLSQTIANYRDITRTNYNTGSIGSTTVNVVNTDSPNTQQIDFGYQSVAKFCVNSFADYNKDGVKVVSEPPSEPPINNLSTSLYNQSLGGIKVGNSILTGNIDCFDNSSGQVNYTIRQNKPEGGLITNLSSPGMTYTDNYNGDTNLAAVAFTSKFGLSQTFTFGYKGQSFVCPYPTFKDLTNLGTYDNPGDLVYNGMTTILKDNLGNQVGSLQTSTTVTTDFNQVNSNCFSDILQGSYRLSQNGVVNTYSTTGGNDKVITVNSAGTISEQFGYRGDPKICPVVYRDDNSNGVKDSGEVLLSGATITLTGNGLSTPLTLISNTNVNTCFSETLNPGTYTVSSVSSFSGYNITTAQNKNVAIDFNGTVYPEFGFNGNNTVCVARTFKDKLGSTFDTGLGQYNSSDDTLIGGIITYLKYTNNVDAKPPQTTGNDPNNLDTFSKTCFTDVVPGEYILSQQSIDGLVSSTGGSKTMYLLPSQNIDVEFGYTGSSTLCANPTFDDTNFDGVKNTTEDLLSGVTTKLSLASNPLVVILTQQTDVTGSTCFTGLFNDSYILKQDTPAQFNYDPNTSTTIFDGTNSYTYQLSQNEYKGLSFGYSNDPSITMGAIRGFFYIDRNENGAYNPLGGDQLKDTVYDNDIPVTKQEIKLYKKNGNSYEIIGSQITQSDQDNPEKDGTYAFTNLEPGDYKIEAPIPQGTRAVIPQSIGDNPPFKLVTITSAMEKITAQNFSFQYTSKICPSLFVDKNNDGQFNGDDLDLLTTYGGYFLLQYTGYYGGTQIEDNYNYKGYLLNGDNPCIESVAPRNYTVIFNRIASVGNGTIQYPGLQYPFDPNFYNEIDEDIQVTVFLADTIDVSFRFYTNFVIDTSSSTLAGSIFNDHFSYGNKNLTGDDGKTGIETLNSKTYNRDFDNDFGYSGITLKLAKCAPGFGETQADVDNWNGSNYSNAPSVQTDSNGNFAFNSVDIIEGERVITGIQIPPGKYSLYRVTDIPEITSLRDGILGDSSKRCLFPGQDDPNRAYDFEIYNGFSAKPIYAFPTPSDIQYNNAIQYKASLSTHLFIDQNKNGTLDNWETNGNSGGNVYNGITAQIDFTDKNGIIQHSRSYPDFNNNNIPHTPVITKNIKSGDWDSKVYPIDVRGYTLLPGQSYTNDASVNTNGFITNPMTGLVSSNQTYILGFTPTNNSSISGKAFVDRPVSTGDPDLDKLYNGVYNPNGFDGNFETTFDNDKVFAGYNITLYYGEGYNQVAATTTSDSNGDYTFTGLTEGNYSIKITSPIPDNFTCTKVLQGHNNCDLWFYLEVDQNRTGVNITYNYNSTLTIKAFFDTYQNNVRDDKESPVRADSGMKFTVKYVGATPQDIYTVGIFSDGDIYGNIHNGIGQLPAGNYQIIISSIPTSISLIGNYPNNTDSVTILAKESVVKDYAFTPYTNNTIKGYVFIDRPNDLMDANSYDKILTPKGVDGIDGTFDDEKTFNGISGATVRLTGPLGTISTNTTTDIYGNPGYYEFKDLPTGRYTMHKSNSLTEDIDLNDPLSTSLSSVCVGSKQDLCKIADIEGVWGCPVLPSICFYRADLGISVYDADIYGDNNFTYAYSNLISARCIEDLNGDGMFTIYPPYSSIPDDSVMNGCSFKLDVPNGVPITTTGTNFAINSLPNGVYTLTKTVNPPDKVHVNTGKRDVSPVVNLGPVNSISLNFITSGGYRQKAYYDFFQYAAPLTANASITGKVFVDVQKDGLYQASGLDGNILTTRDNDSLVPGVSIKLIRPGNQPPICTTSSNSLTNTGKFQFTDLPKGDYSVKVGGC